MAQRRLSARTSEGTAASMTGGAHRPTTAIRAEPDTVTVHVPIAFQRRGGRRTVTAPDGSPVALAASRPDVNSTLVKALARAFRWRNLIETGVHSTIHDLAAAERMNPSYVSRILRLTLLAPEVVETVLDGRHWPNLTLDAAMKPFPTEWENQRRLFRDG